MAAGVGSRFGGTKQLAEVGPSGEAVLDYTLADALGAGFRRVVLVVRTDLRAPVVAHLRRFHRDASTFRLVCQDQDRTAPPRERPWGTGHAVLAAAGEVPGAFGVVNADDFYGREAIALLGDVLRERGGPGRFHLVAYRLASTLSPRGTVSRGVCEVDASGHLASVREHRAIARVPDGTIRSRPPDGPSLPDDAAVSLNLWGLHASLFSPLAEGFRRFVTGNHADPTAEYLLPEVIGDVAASGEATVEVHRTDAEWHGVTYPGDLEDVRSRVAQLVAGGAYPTPLRTPTPPTSRPA
jgi:hypothetical protein